MAGKKDFVSILRTDPFLINSSRTVLAKYLYDSYGNLLNKTGPLGDANLYRFSSKETHIPSGLYYYGFRYYEPNLQRWLNRDPIEEAGGKNLFAFVNGNPISLIDPLGLWHFNNHGGISPEMPLPDDPAIRDEGPQQLADAFSLYAAATAAKSLCSLGRSLAQSLARQLAARELLAIERAVASATEKVTEARIKMLETQGMKALTMDEAPIDHIRALARAADAREDLIAAEKELESLKQAYNEAAARASQ
jgi:RHS repeat-associated protein